MKLKYVMEEERLDLFSDGAQLVEPSYDDDDCCGF